MGVDRDRLKSGDNEDWLDFLTRDPTPAAERMRLREQVVREASKPQGRHPRATPQPTPATPQNKHKYKKYSNVFRAISDKLPRNKKFLIASGVTVLVLVTGVTAFIIKSNLSDKKNVASNTGIPDYALPDGSSEGVEGDIRYDTEKELIGYKDSIGGVEISVNQQPIPEEMKADIDETIKKAADEMGATTVLVTATPTAYLKTAALDKQIVLFAKGDKVFVIQSEGKIDEYDWATYITNLK